MKDDTRADTSNVRSISAYELQQEIISRATRDRLINALREIRTVCESWERCNKDCMFARPTDTSHELYGCEIMGFVDDFGDPHATEVDLEAYGRLGEKNEQKSRRKRIDY